jgi:hypothetical protein
MAASRFREVALRSALWLLLGGWLGAWGLFAFVVAPTAFGVLPSTEIAGTLVGPVLAALHPYGVGAGLGLALLGRALGRGALLTALPLVTSAVCVYSHFGVSAEIAEIRDLAFGPDGSADGGARFSELHRLSVMLYTAIGMAVAALVVLHAKDAPRGSD